VELLLRAGADPNQPCPARCVRVVVAWRGVAWRCFFAHELLFFLQLPLPKKCLQLMMCVHWSPPLQFAARLIHCVAFAWIHD
jgi:hypothetical protein